MEAKVNLGVLSAVMKAATRKYGVTFDNVTTITIPTKSFTARTINVVHENRFVIYFSSLRTIALDTYVHEIAHVVAWKLPSLKAEGHNTEYMNILYTLEQELYNEQNQLSTWSLFRYST